MRTLRMPNVNCAMIRRASAPSDAALPACCSPKSRYWRNVAIGIPLRCMHRAIMAPAVLRTLLAFPHFSHADGQLNLGVHADIGHATRSHAAVAAASRARAHHGKLHLEVEALSVRDALQAQAVVHGVRQRLLPPVTASAPRLYAAVLLALDGPESVPPPPRAQALFSPYLRRVACWQRR